MTEEKTLAQIAHEAFEEYARRRTGSRYALAWLDSSWQKEFEAAASAVREKVIEDLVQPQQSQEFPRCVHLIAAAVAAEREACAEVADFGVKWEPQDKFTEAWHRCANETAYQVSKAIRARSQGDRTQGEPLCDHLIAADGNEAVFGWLPHYADPLDVLTWKLSEAFGATISEKQWLAARELLVQFEPQQEGDRTALHPDQRELETNLIHPHPRQDGQQCDHPGSEPVK